MSQKTNEPRPDKGADDEPRLRTIPIDRIVIGPTHRSHDAEAINNMAVSIREVGVIAPVLLQYAGKNDDGERQYACISGALRICGAKEIGYTEITAITMKGDEDHLQLCGIAADFFRDDLTVLQKAEFLKDWVRIMRAKGGQSAKPGGHQPHDKQLSKAAKALKLSRRLTGRLETIGDLSADVKKAIKAAELDDSQNLMLAIAKEATAQKQIEKVEELLRDKDVKTKPKPKNPGSPGLGPKGSSNSASPDPAFEKLKAVWERYPEFVTEWNDAPLPARERFIKQVLRPSGRGNAAQANKAAG
jgi:ParB family chromosome partitioning protein